MFAFASNDFIEAVDADIEVLKRSTEPVVLQGAHDDSYELDAYLCLHRHEGVPLCHIAFYYRPLKRSIVFAVIGDQEKVLVEDAERLLDSLEFQLSPVNLKFSPAMLQVVLQDIPAVRTPEKVSKFRQDGQSLLTDLETAAEPSEENPDGDRVAKQRLAAEQRKLAQLASLRTLLEQQLSPSVPDASATAGSGDRERSLKADIGKLQAELDEERSARGVAEQITEALEKRLQELEKTLVDYETEATGSVKQGQKVLELTRRVEELERQLSETESRLADEQQSRQDVEEAAARATDNHEELNSEIQALRSQLDEATAARESMAAERDEAQQLHTGLTEQLQQLETRADDVEGERKRLQSEREQALLRVAALEESLRQAEQSTAGAIAAGASAGSNESELHGRLEDVLKQLEEETAARVELGRDLDEARLRLRTLGRQLEKAAGQGAGAGEAVAKTHLDEANQQIDALQTELDQLKAELEQEQVEGKRLEKELIKMEGKFDVLKDELAQARSQAPVAQVQAPAATTSEVPVETGRRNSRGPLPHEQRKPSPKDAFFQVNWELQGFPCQSADLVAEAWGSIFNVQLTLEGYPTQYCSAFIVIVKEGKGQKLYMFFSLKDNKYTLVYEPANPPKNNKAMQKALDEARRFMMVSGVEFEELSRDEIATRLSAYFL